MVAAAAINKKRTESYTYTTCNMSHWITAWIYVCTNTCFDSFFISNIYVYKVQFSLCTYNCAFVWVVDAVEFKCNSISF